VNADPGPMPAFLDRTRLVHSYTSLHTYEDVCPHQYFHRYILKDLPFEKTEAMEFGNKVHSAMELRVGAKKPLHPDFAHWEPFARPFDVFTNDANSTLAAELKLGIKSTGESCDFWDKEVWLRVKLDVVAVVGTNAFINDWKSGSSKYQTTFELETQALLLHARMPGLTTIKGGYTWLKENAQGPCHDLSDTRATWNKVNAIVKNIERDRARGEFEKRQGPLCGWCDVVKCEHNRKKK
jgi:PD-(D/E)XK nuclease superfamily